MLVEATWTKKHSGTSKDQGSGVRDKETVVWSAVVKTKIRAYQIVLSLAHDKVRLAWSDGGFDFE